MQYHKVTKYTIWYNEMQCNTIKCKIAYDTFQTKTEHFWPKKGPFWAISARKQPAEQLNRHLMKNQKYPKLHQDWVSYDPIKKGTMLPFSVFFRRASLSFRVWWSLLRTAELKAVRKAKNAWLKTLFCSRLSIVKT